jgi:hypothetical protein
MSRIKTIPMLIGGEVMHARTLPKANKFEYKNLYLYLPLSFANKLKSKLFSIGKFNLFSFYSQDHEAIEKILSQNQISGIENIALISHPRILGYAFNPASFWLCFDKKENLIATLVEVNNTFSQKHSYLLFNENLQPIEKNQWLESKKDFHVSPFFEQKGLYKFRFVINDNQMDFYINYFVDKKLYLTTSFKCEYQKLTDVNLLKHFLKMPFLMFKTIFLIHFQAFKLWVFKGAKYHSLPKKLEHNLTISKNAKT